MASGQTDSNTGAIVDEGRSDLLRGDRLGALRVSRGTWSSFHIVNVKINGFGTFWRS